MSVALKKDGLKQGDVVCAWVSPDISTTDVHVGFERHAFVIGWNKDTRHMPHGTEIVACLDTDKVTLQFNDGKSVQHKELDHKVFYDHVVEFLQKLKDCCCDK